MKKKVCIVLMLLLGEHLNGFSADTDILAGKGIFQSHCTACHSVLNKVVGPALKDVDKRHDEKWLLNFVHSSQSLVKKGDPDAIKLFNDNNGIVMPDHADLNNADILNVIAYIKDESTKLDQPQTPNPERPIEVKPSFTPLTFYDFGTWVLYSIIVVAIIITLYTFVLIFSFLNKPRS